MKYLLVIGFVFLLSSCGLFSRSKDKKEGILAKVGNKYLYAKDIDGLIQPGTSAKDSVQKLNIYVENWIKLQLMVQKAELNLTAERKNFDQELENLRTTLLIHSYQEKYVEQNLDTVVTEPDIQEYYKENKEQFVLRKNIVKTSYIIFSRNIREREKVKSWFLSKKENERSKLLKFCNENAITYQLNDTSWQFMDELERIIPFDYSSQESFLSRAFFYETQDSSMVYMVKFTDYKSKENISPIEFERPVIKSLIINIRKQVILRKMEEDIYREAVEKKTFQNFVE